MLGYFGSLVRAALDDAEDPSASVAALAQRALRIARLRGDWEVVWWLQLEMLTIKPYQDDDGSALRASAEAKEHLSESDFQLVGEAVGSRWLGGRKVKGNNDDETLQHLGIPDAELRVAELREHIEQFGRMGAAPNMALALAQLRVQVREMESLLARIRKEIAVYLSGVERRLVLGEVSEDVWVRNRGYVDERLAQIAPQALEQFAAAHRRRVEGDAEARSHALTSCRRVLKTLADVLYPASNAVVHGLDGRIRKMTDDKFVSRLCQYVSDQGGSSSTRLLLAQVRSLAERLDAINSLSSKGVHGEVSSAEVDQCVIQTYLVVGDLLRIGESGPLTNMVASGVQPVST